MQSQKGVSMPLALLLFLICATLASIVLAAATTTAGQATTLKDNEQSYYAVTSAAKMLRDELNGQTVVVTETKTGSTTTVTLKDELRQNTPTTNFTLLELATGKMKNLSSYQLPTSIVLDSGFSDPVKSALKVNIKPTFSVTADHPDGELTLTLSQAAADAPNSKVDGYKLKLTLVPDIEVSAEETTTSGSAETKVTETRITWWAEDLQTTGSTP